MIAETIELSKFNSDVSTVSTYTYSPNISQNASKCRQQDTKTPEMLKLANEALTHLVPSEGRRALRLTPTRWHLAFFRLAILLAAVGSVTL